MSHVSFRRASRTRRCDLTDAKMLREMQLRADQLARERWGENPP